MVILDLILILLIFYFVTLSFHYQKENKNLRNNIYSKDNFISHLRLIIDAKNKEINNLKEGK